MNGEVREVIQRAIARIFVGVDGSLTVEAKPGGILGIEGISPAVQCWDGGPLLQHMIVAASERKWRLSSAPEE